MNPELVRFGTSVREVLAYRNRAEDWELFPNVSALLMYRAESDGLQSLSEPERFISSIGAMLRDVNNGGWEQFFGNTDGVLVSALVPALTAVGSTQFRLLAADALFHGEANGESTEWDTHDEQFYACEEQLEGLCLSYLERNLAAVRT